MFSSFTFPPVIYELCQFLHILLTLVFFFFLNYSHSTGHEMVSHCILMYISLMTNDIYNFFM